MSKGTTGMIVLLIFINLITSVSYAIYENPTTFQSETVTDTISIGADYGNNFSADNNQQGQQQGLLVEGTVGNAIRMGISIVSLFTIGIHPFSTPTTNANVLDKLFMFAMMLFRAVMWILIGIEAYIFFKNRGQK